MDNRDYIRDYYESYDEDGRLRTRYGGVEFITTMHYVERYLQPGCRIIEIGAGTGRYSHALARRGYRVDAVELIEHNIEIFRRNTEEGEPVTISRGNALDLAAYADDTYDITLLLGPMYHLFSRNDQRRALAEAVRVTKPGGIVFAAYCMGDASILQYGFMRGKIHEIVEKCMIDTETFEAFSKPWDIFELYRKEDIDALRGTVDVAPLHYVSADGYANHMREALENMDEEAYQLFLKYHLATCERIELTGYANHTLDIFRKN